MCSEIHIVKMFRTITVVLALAIGSTYAVGNGTVTEKALSSPWQVKLYMSAGLTDWWPCGGTLISKNYVLTAARCFTYQKNDKAHDFYVYLGMYDIESYVEEHRVTFYDVSLQHAIIHDEYNATTHQNDIALIKLPASVNFTEFIQPIKLNKEPSIKTGDVVHISGWQYPIREYDPMHQYPHGGDVTVVDVSACKNTYPENVIDDDTICASGTVAFCYGDEGIAFALDNEMVGMAYGAKAVRTPSEECPIVPQTYLPIAKYLDWIKKNSDYEDS